MIDIKDVRSTEVSALRKEPLAIVGIGCRFPGGVKDPKSFWDLVIKARDGIVDVPTDRWDADWFYDPNPNKPGKMFVRKGGFLDQPVEGFDALFFGISPREAERMDPQQRLLLETSWEALEDAGIPADRLAGTNTGVFIGAFTFDNQVTQLGIESRHLISAQTPTSSTFTMLSNRLSYFYDLRGPSVSMDTACSSSLVALHHACGAIWGGDCDMALAGGANIVFRPETVISMCKGGFLSPDGRSKSFDSRANGYGRGEGSGVIVIKTLSAAMADRDRIYSVIRATGVNQDGRTNGITVPNPDSQQALCRSVCEQAGIAPESIQYLEAHGTGTPVGDPIEAGSLGNVYGKSRPEGKTVALGSIKANIGHTEAAAGVAGVIKACLSLHHNTIPPLANLEEPNPNIPFEELGLRLPRSPEPMEDTSDSPKAAVNSFGYGGTNAHVILEQYREPTPTTSRIANGSAATHNGKGAAASYSTVNRSAHLDSVHSNNQLLLPVSARSSEALIEAVRAIVEILPALATSYSIAEICHSAALRRCHHNHRLIARCSSTEDLREKLECYLRNGQADGIITGKVENGPVQKPVFVFTGMGPQWWGMGRELMQQDSLFRTAVEECDAILQGIAGWSIIEELSKDEEASRVTETQIAQPANFVLQYGLTKMLEARGISPAAILGHSVGEVTAACVSGVLNLEDALTVSFHRSRIQAKAAGRGGMLAVGLSLSEAETLLLGHEDSVSIAAVNSPTSVTLAGDTPVLATIAAQLEQRAVFNRMLDVEVPYHSHYMDPLKAETLSHLEKLRPTLPAVTLYSTVTGKAVTDVKYDASYWCDNIREPVRFANTIASALADEHALFLEVGPHPVLSTSLRECILESGSVAATAATLRKRRPEMATFMEGVCQLYCAGLLLDWHALLPASDRFVPLPLYPFQREAHWFESPVASASRRGVGEDNHPLLTRRTASHNPTWESPLNVGVLPYIPEHQVDGVVVFPGAGYIESALAMHHQLTGMDETVLTDIQLLRALVVDGEDDPLISISLDEKSQRFSVHSRTNQDQDRWTEHATGIVSAVPPGLVATVDLGAVRSRCKTAINIDDLYDQLAKRGLVYGDHFRRIAALSRSEREALARIEPHDAPGRNMSSYRLHPTMLDSCFQSLVALISPDLGGASTFVPVAIDRLILREVPRGGFWCVSELVDSTAHNITGNLTLIDDHGEVFAQVRGFRCQALARGKQQAASLLGHIAYDVEWEQLESVNAIQRAGRWLIFADHTGVADALCRCWSALDQVTPLVVTNAPEYRAVDENSFTVPFGDADEMLRLIDQLDEVAGVIWLHGLDSASRYEFNDGTSADVEGLDAVECFSTFVRTLDAAGRSWRVCGVTRNATPALSGDTVSGVAQAPLTGLLKVALNEYPELQITSIDIDDSPASLQALAAEVLADTEEDSIAIRAGVRLAQRIVRTPVKEYDSHLAEERPSLIPATQPFVLEQPTLGSIDSLVLRQTERRAPEAGEIEVQLAATSLNFKDIAKVMNIMSDAALEGTYHERGLGLEASGRVVKVGQGVTDFAIGDPVVFSVKGCFRNYATLKVDPRVLHKITDKHDLVEAAGIPTVFMTTYHALVDIARLQPGEKVLIHAGAGGVGLAAIQIAQWIGAEIFATAGSEQKREYLSSLGVPHVMDSRSIDFAEQISDITKGRGVDVVLNSLPKEYIHKSLEALAPFGRFVEIGKKDLVEGTNISLQPFNKVLSFSTVDFDIMVAQRPDLSIRVVKDLLGHFEAEDFSPIRTTTFPPSQLREAFKYMARSQHIGKVIIDWTAEGTVDALPPREESSVFKSKACYLVSGGCGGFGLAMARWLINRGVRHLVLVGRSGAGTDEARAAIEAMRTTGANVHVACADVTDRGQVKSLIDELSTQDVPLKGVFHAAAVLDDAPIGQLNRDRFSQVMRPKILGARNLDACTRHIELDMFVMFSSVASMIGNARQSSYVAANAWFDAFAAHRRAQGLAATSVNWGPIADVGMAASSETLIKTLAASGFTPTTVDDGMEALQHALRWQPTQLGLFNLDWSAWAATEPTSGASPRFASLVATGKSDIADHPLYRELAAMPEEDRTEVLNYVLIEQIAETLRIPVEKLEANDSISDLGMDSLMAVELQTMVRVNMGVELSSLEMMKGENIGQMGAMILSKMNLSDSDETEPNGLANLKAKDVDDMSDEEVDRLLESVAE